MLDYSNSCRFVMLTLLSVWLSIFAENRSIDYLQIIKLKDHYQRACALNIVFYHFFNQTIIIFYYLLVLIILIIIINYGIVIILSLTYYNYITLLLLLLLSILLCKYTRHWQWVLLYPSRLATNHMQIYNLLMYIHKFINLYITYVKSNEISLWYKNWLLPYLIKKRCTNVFLLSNRLILF